METVRILGIDPGSRHTGYAILEYRLKQPTSLLCDSINLTSYEDWQERLRELYSFIVTLINTHQPDICAIEVPVYGKDPLAMMKLGRAQAAVIMAALHKQVPVFEYYPKAVKKSITGNGNASKQQVAFMLDKIISNLDEIKSNDATDALAVAWCHLQKMNTLNSVDNKTTLKKSGRSKTSWSSFLKDNPERIRKP